MRESVGKAKAAGFAGDGGSWQLGGEAGKPLLYDTRYRAKTQDPILERLATDQRRAQVLAVHYITLAERFLQEAETLGDLLRESEVLAS